MITVKVTGIQKAKKDIANSVYQVARAAIVKTDQIIQSGQPRTDKGNPVWTGYSKANWYASIETPIRKLTKKPAETSIFVQIVTNQLNSIHRPAAESADASLPKSNNDYSTLYLTNIVDYIEFLEAGLNRYKSVAFTHRAVESSAKLINSSNRKY